jgi:hypothetical protein
LRRRSDPLALNLSPEEETWQNRVRDALKDSEDYLRPWRMQCNEHYRQYRTVAAAREHVRQTPPDRDAVNNELFTQFGQEIHIPIAYSTIETMLPRAVQNRPRGLVLPNERMADDNVENMRLLIDDQQKAFRYEMLSQEIVKSGLLYGLGVKKGPYWKRVIQRGMPYLRRATDAQTTGSPFVEAVRDRVQYDDAWGEQADIFDCFWDRYGYDSFTLRWFAFRVWRDSEYVADQLGLSEGMQLPDRSQAPWNTPAAQQITADRIKGMAIGQQQMDGVWRDRQAASGHINTPATNDLHEVIEFWTAKGDRVVILDREAPVAIGKNPFWHGEIPSHFYRPQTAGINQLHGISEIEPLSELIRELNTMRTSRRDNILLAIQRVMVFDEDAVDRDDLQYGPGVAIPVRSDDPRAHLFPIDQPDIPFSAFRDTDELKQDMDRVSGISDTVAGAAGAGAAQTATGAQLMTTAAGIRIENKSRRYEAETVVPFTNQMILLNQQMVLEKNIRVPVEPQPGEIDVRPWQWITLTPAELSGLMSYEVEGGSMAPKNLAQEAQMGQALWATLKDDPSIDQTRLRKHYLESQGIKSAGAWVLPQPNTPPGFVQAVAKIYGPEKVQQIMSLIGGGQGQ